MWEAEIGWIAVSGQPEGQSETPSEWKEAGCGDGGTCYSGKPTMGGWQFRPAWAKSET
jgi:hypothetical protein